MRISPDGAMSMLSGTPEGGVDLDAELGRDPRPGCGAELRAEPDEDLELQF